MIRGQGGSGGGDRADVRRAISGSQTDVMFEQAEREGRIAAAAFACIYEILPPAPP